MGSTPGCYERRGSEGGLVVVDRAAARGRSGPPRVVGGSPAVPAAATTAEAPAAAAPADLVDLGRGVAERRADLVDLELDDGALLALARLERPLPQAALHHHAHATGERLGDVLRCLAPDVAAQEQGVAVLPLAGLAVEGARGGRHREVGDGGPGRGEAKLRIGGEVADHRDDGLAGHRDALSPRGRVRPAAARLPWRRASSGRAAAPWCAAPTR